MQYSFAPGTSGYLGLSPVASKNVSAVYSVSFPFLSVACDKKKVDFFSKMYPKSPLLFKSCDNC